jgi:hypothetical protein
MFFYFPLPRRVILLAQMVVNPMVVNLSPKGWSALADSAPVFGRQLMLPPVGIKLPSAHRGKSANADAMVGESPSVKHRLPLIFDIK